MRLLILFLLLSTNLFGQVFTSHIIEDTTLREVTYMDRAGSCGSPDGAMNSILASPPNYTWLQNNGYCNPNTYGTNPTVCWTFTPTSTSVTINSGYSQTGCNNIGFGSFNLYNNSCVLVGNGLTFTGLTIGQQYTWCMTGSAWGGGGCSGFNDFCPYFFNNSMLPIELSKFEGESLNGKNILVWETLSESNNDFFTIERSKTGEQWEEIGTIDGSGNSSITQKYQFIDDKPNSDFLYYRLKQTDYNGYFEYFKPISIENYQYKPELIEVLDLTGRKTDTLSPGLKLYYYSNGDVKKIMK